ncbi:MAG: hypothetical protein KAU91_04830 [Candidatus Aminicenantes bacterium]|nr:hypothetical protein [Candidatus Aminicenantes bacterium]
MKKCIALFLVFSSFVLSGNLYAKKKGAELIVQKIVGQQVRGELITVKENSLLLLDSESGADVSVDIREIKLIEIVKKSKSLAWGGIGLVSGAVIGALIGYLEGDDYPIGETGVVITWPGPTPITADEKALNYGIGCGILGGVLGGIGGAIAGADKTIQIEGKSETEIRKALNKLCKKARVRNSQ